MCVRKIGRIENHSSNTILSVFFLFPLYTYTVFFCLLIWMWENEPQRKPHTVFRASQAICCVDTATKRRHLAIGVGVIINEMRHTVGRSAATPGR